jgi:5-methyltetrahydrofolate--homocysteine methyltransferase
MLRGKMDNQFQTIYQSILDGQNKDIGAQVEKALQNSVSPKSILEEGMISAMAEVGRLFEAGEYYIPEMLISARAMQAGLAILKPHLADTQYTATGKVAIGTVKGDLHDIGKNLVAMMLEGAGFEVMDLGVDVTPEKFAEIADRVDVIALSALLTTTMLNMKTVIDALKAAGKRDQVRVVVGGAPVTSTFAEVIGADGYAQDASQAVSMIKALMKQE